MATEESLVREAEVKSYLEKHKILEIFNDLTSSLVYHKPDNPRKFMIAEIEKIRKVRENSFQPPLLLTKKNAEAIYDTLDPVGRGHISLQQYIDTMNRLGVRGFKTYENESNVRITKELFADQFSDGTEGSGKIGEANKSQKSLGSKPHEEIQDFNAYYQEMEMREELKKRDDFGAYNTAEDDSSDDEASYAASSETDTTYQTT